MFILRFVFPETIRFLYFSRSILPFLVIYSRFNFFLPPCQIYALSCFPLSLCLNIISITHNTRPKIQNNENSQKLLIGNAIQNMKSINKYQVYNIFVLDFFLSYLITRKVRYCSNTYNVTLTKLTSIPVLHVTALSSIDQICKRCIPYFKHSRHHGEEKEVQQGQME